MIPEQLEQGDLGGTIQYTDGETKAKSHRRQYWGMMYSQYSIAISTEQYHCEMIVEKIGTVCAKDLVSYKP